MLDLIIGFVLGFVLKFKWSIILTLVYLAFVLFGLAQFPEMAKMWRIDHVLLQFIGMMIGAYVRVNSGKKSSTTVARGEEKAKKEE